MEGTYVPRVAELGALCMPASSVTSGAPGVDAGLPSVLGRITILVSSGIYVNHSWFGSVLNLSLDALNFPVTLTVRKLRLGRHHGQRGGQ